MNRTPWLLVVVNALILILLAAANFISRAKTIPGWLGPLADWLAVDPLKWVFFFTVVGVLLPIADKAFGAHNFRKLKAQRILNKLVDELLDGDGKKNRVTLFKAARGWRVFLSLFWRMIWYADEKGRSFGDIIRIRPWGLYLYVYARPSKTKNPRSCAVYRVFREQGRGCEGMAGTVWIEDEYTARNIPAPFASGELRTVKKLSDYSESHPYRKYAELTNIRDERQLRAREHYGKHFHGTRIESQEGGGWGVLLLDSTAQTCPIGESKKKNDAADQWLKRYSSYAEILSSILT
jgi:hypothetical protein